MRPVVIVVVLGCLAVLGPAEGIVTKYDPSTADDNAGEDNQNDRSGDRGSAGGVLQRILDQFDPFVVPDQSFSLRLKEIALDARTSNLVVRGLSGLKLNSLLLTEIAEGKASVNISLPSISVEGNYEMTGEISHDDLQLSLDGKGPLKGGFEGLELCTSIELGINKGSKENRGGQILLEDFDLVWNMTDIQVQIDGLFGGKELGQIINRLLGDTLPHLVLKVYHGQITSSVIDLVKTKGATCLYSLHEDHTEAQPKRARSSSRLGLGGDGGFDVCGFHIDAPEKPAVLQPMLQLLRLVLEDDKHVVKQHVVARTTVGDAKAHALIMDSNPVGAAAQTSGGRRHQASLLHVEPKGAPRVHLHGALSVDGDDGLVLAEDAVEQLLVQHPQQGARSHRYGSNTVPPSARSNLVTDAFQIIFAGETRFYPHGILAKGDE